MFKYSVANPNSFLKHFIHWCIKIRPEINSTKLIQRRKWIKNKFRFKVGHSTTLTINSRVTMQLKIDEDQRPKDRNVFRSKNTRNKILFEKRKHNFMVRSFWANLEASKELCWRFPRPQTEARQQSRQNLAHEPQFHFLMEWNVFRHFLQHSKSKKYFFLNTFRLLH